jgi:hypothetical protein
VQKAGPNSPSLVDIVSLLDIHTPDFILLTETPFLPNNAALTHILRNKRYTICYHLSNAPSSPDILPEARLLDNLTHPRGECWIAYRKYTTWAAHVRPLRLPIDCPLATTCAVEITLYSGEKAANIASHLPQPKEEHERACKALARLPVALPHHLLIFDSDLQAGWTSSTPNYANVHALPFLRWRGAKTPIFTLPHQPGVATCIDHLTMWDPRHLTEQIGDTITLSTSFWITKEV